MRKLRNDIDSEVEKTLAALDAMKPADPKPFLFTRISAKMESQQMRFTTTIFASRIVDRVFAAVMAGLVAINLFTMSQFLGKDQVTADTATEEVTFMEDYYSESLNFYSIDETLNP